MKKLIITILCLSVQGFAAQQAVTRVTTTHTITSSEEVTLISGSGYTVTLPECSSSNDGEYHTIKNTGSGAYAIAICPNGNDTVSQAGCWYEDGQSSGYQSNTFICDGDNHDWAGLNYW